MAIKKYAVLSLSIFLLVFVMGIVSSATLAEWDLLTDGTASNVLSNVNAGNFVAGAGLSGITYSIDGASASLWTDDTTKNDSDYFEITLTPDTDYEMIITNVDLSLRRDNTGPESYIIEWSKDSDFASSSVLEAGTLSDDSEVDINIDGLNININEGETFYLRIFGYDSGDSAGTLRVNDRTLVVEGSVSETDPDWSDDFCLWDDGSSDNEGELRIKIKDISNKGIRLADINGDSFKKFGDDEEWFLFETIEVEVEVSTRNYEVEDIVLEWGLYNTKSNEWVIDVSEEDDFDLDDDEEETVTFTFEIDEDMDQDLDELEDGSHYVLYVRAVGEIDDSDSSYDGDYTCESESEGIELIIEDDFVVIYDLDFPKTLACGSELYIRGDVWNIGEDDQDDVFVRFFNRDLGIDKILEVGDIDAFDDKKLDFTFIIPEDAEEKRYVLEIVVLDEDKDVYENDYDDEESRYTITFDIEGNCGADSGTEGDAVISASLESGGEAGKELVVKASVTNLGESLKSYSLGIKGYSSWATLESIEPETFVLSAGESKDILLTMIVNKDALGDQIFELSLFSDNQEILIQPASVTIQESTGKISWDIFSGDNVYLWVIGALNIILVIIIIIVAVRVAKK